MTTRFPTTTHTAGTTYSRAGLYALPAGTWSATATVKTAGGTLVQALAVNLAALGSPDVDGNTHSLSLLATAAETTAWPLQQLLCDIIFTDASVDPVKVPAVTVAINVSAHTVPLSDADNPLQTISGDMAPVLRGATGPAGADSTVPGPTGPAGATGAPGADGQGVPTGGTTGQVLAKASGTNFDTEWVDPAGGGGGATNLAYTASPTGGTVTSDTGTDATIPLADGTNAGLMTPAQKATLDATSGTNTGDQDLSGYSLSSHNHTGIYDPAGTAASAVSAHEGAADPHPGYALESALGSAAAANTTDFAPAAHVGAGASAHANAIAAGAAGFMTGADKSKLDGIASGAQVNPTDTDGLSEGSTNLYHTAARVLGQVLTGLSTAAGTVVTSAHTILQAIGFLQKQVSDNTTALSGKAETGAIGSSGLTMATNKLLGRNTAATGAIEEITLGTNLSMTGTTLNAAGGAVSAADVELSPPTVILGITNAQQGFELIEALLEGFEIAVATAISEKLDLAGGALTGPLEMVEVGTAPAAPGANTVSIYAEDNGSGKTRLMARFATGAPVQVAIEP